MGVKQSGGYVNFETWNTKVTPSGKSWKTDFSIDNLPQRKITITKGDQPKSDGTTKMCIQGSHPHYLLFTNLEVPKIFKQVMDKVKSPIYSIKEHTANSFQVRKSPLSYSKPLISAKLKSDKIQKSSSLKSPHTKTPIKLMTKKQHAPLI